LVRRKLLTALAAASMLAISPASAQGIRYSDSYTFIKAVKDRDGAKVTDLIGGARGPVVVNSKSGDTGEGALHILTKGRDLTWLGFLLSKGARPDIQDKDGNTPLGLAASLGWVEGAQMLLARGASANATNARGETPLILAVHTRDPTMVRLLLTKGADPKRSDSVAGYSALDYARQDPRAAAILKMLEEKQVPKKEVAGPVL
jgi:hypothetical protein